MQTRGKILRVAICSGVFVKHDAISESLGWKLRLFERLRMQGAPVQARIFCRGTNIAGLPITVVDGVDRLLLEPDFLRADVVCFEFGIYYDLFDTIFVLPKDVARIGVYHNVTPPQLVAPEQRLDIDRSIRQRGNLSAAHHVVCVSEYNRRDVLALGIPKGRTSIVPLPVPLRSGASLRLRAPMGPDHPIEVLYVGRLVSAKGVRDLLAAAQRLRAGSAPDFRLTMVFNANFSDPGLLNEVYKLAEQDGASHWLRLIPDASDVQLSQLYSYADCFVLPSYHEGFGVPIIEALSAGCQIISSDAGNLPFLVNGLGTVFASGNIEELTAALRRIIVSLAEARCERRMPVRDTECGLLPYDIWADAVERYLRTFSRDRCESSFLAAMCDALCLAGRSVPEWLREAQSGLADV